MSMKDDVKPIPVDKLILATINYEYLGHPMTERIVCCVDGNYDLLTEAGDDVGWTKEVIVDWCELPVPEESKEAQPDSVEEIRVTTFQPEDFSFHADYLVSLRNGGHQGNINVSALADELIRARSELTSLRGAGWVSVDDGMPDTMREVQAEIRDGDIFIAHRELEESEEEGASLWWSKNDDQEIYNVIRWRYTVPQPPDAAKEREKEK